MTIVPFGKYKDRPVEDMLADADYMTWLEAQPWFRDRFGHLLPQDMRDDIQATPTHNKLQVLFLNSAYCIAFARAAGKKSFSDQETMARASVEKNCELAGLAYILSQSELAKVRAERQSWCAKNPGAADDNWQIREFDHDERRHAQSAERAGRQLDALNSAKYVIKAMSAFEVAGADVVVLLRWQWPSFEHGYDVAGNERRFRIEIKPTMGDDYPVVLRQMQRHKTTYLFVDQYDAEGATTEQMIAIFRAGGKAVVFKRDVDALL